MYLKLKVITKWLTRLVIGFVVPIACLVVWYVYDNYKADLEGEVFAKMFCEDLLEEDYESILSYTYKAEEYDISVEEIEAYMKDQEDLVIILRNPENFSYEESGDLEHRGIVVTSFENGVQYYHGFVLHRKDGKITLDSIQMGDYIGLW